MAEFFDVLTDFEPSDTVARYLLRGVEETSQAKEGIVAKIKFFAGIKGDEFRFERYAESEFVPLVGTRVCVTWLNIPSGKVVSSFYCLIREQWETAIHLEFNPDDYSLVQLLTEAGWHDNRKDYCATEEIPDDESGDSLFTYQDWRVWH